VEFGVKGSRSGIPYQKFANAFKKMLIDGSREGTQHTQRTMEHFNVAVFGSVAVASAGDENAESSEMEPEMDDEDHLVGNNSDTADIESSHTSMHSHTEQFQAMTISSTASSTDYIDPDSDQHANRWPIPLSTNSNAACISTSHRHLTATATPISAPSPLAPVIDTSSRLANSDVIHVATSRQRHPRLTPTASFSAPPPPIVNLEPQLVAGDNIMPADFSSTEEGEEIAQPTMKGRARAKKATTPTRLPHTEPNVGPGHAVQPVARRSTRAQAGQMSKAK
jgi:hypothetical protein